MPARTGSEGSGVDRMDLTTAAGRMRRHITVLLGASAPIGELRQREAETVFGERLWCGETVVVANRPGGKAAGPEQPRWLVRGVDHLPDLTHQSGEIPIIGAEPRPLGPADRKTDRTVGADHTCGNGGRGGARTFPRGINDGFDGGLSFPQQEVVEVVAFMRGDGDPGTALFGDESGRQRLSRPQSSARGVVVGQDDNALHLRGKTTRSRPVAGSVAHTGSSGQVAITL